MAEVLLTCLPVVDVELHSVTSWMFVCYDSLLPGVKRFSELSHHNIPPCKRRHKHFVY